MLGNFQKSQLRIEIEASAIAIRNSILRPVELEKWLPLGHFSSGMLEELKPGFEFVTRSGPIAIHHYVDVMGSDCLRLLLSQGIDGFHEWYWGEGWVQSRIEGVTILPLSLGHTLNLLSLRQFLTSKGTGDSRMGIGN
ncbi:hypothetical protein [Scytonema sp. NUACC26]|uniref:hypothetical protein n=1 Tax=Scytonema sp. NUACC26 TaxID=3140176 RepID=UPI0034DC724B